MNKARHRYDGGDLALVIPTKDRPEKIRDFLTSLSQQSVPCGRVIVVDGGESVKDIVLSFSDRLPVEHYECRPPGQIRQRNLGISLLDDKTPLVAFIDDDIVLEPSALEQMVSFWDNAAPDTAGVSFNIINQHTTLPKWAKGLWGMILPRQGKVLRSGYHVSIENVPRDVKTEWLCGGATVWKQGILREHSNTEISSRWAIGEDLIFSYPLGKEFPLYVCAEAKVRHEHIYDHKVKKRHRYYGRTAFLWRLFFVESHAELSRRLYFLMASGEMAFRLVIGLLFFQKQQIQFALGQKDGILMGLRAIRRGSDLISILNEDTE
jgi:glycosyltransferase involved in cell wall biosynthesis